MTTIKYKKLEDQIKGCWVGKNIGGVFGAPFECKRMVPNVNFYVQDLSMGPPANDDLDLQIVWLSAVERYGRNVNAPILSEYWLSYIIPNWVEYGTGKANLKAGILPPMSGDIDNPYKTSNGCWIRSEIWACLAPGHPEISTRYAYEDAIVDHAGEGMYGEIFTSAIESAAFVENDIHKLIDIGLSYIPENCKMAAAINKAVECYKNHIDFLEARKIIHNTVPGTFGIQEIKLKDIPQKDNDGMEVGNVGFDAPENVAFMVIGLLYGEGDFEKSIIYANNCGEDTDCTCATLGALLGIIKGASSLPSKWVDPLDDKITTVCIDKSSNGIWVPETVTDLSNRILRNIPAFLGADLCTLFTDDVMGINVDETDLHCRNSNEYLPYNKLMEPDEPTIKDLCSSSPYIARYQFTAFNVTVDYHNSVFYTSGENRSFTITVKNSFSMREQQWVKIKLYLPEGIEAIGASSVELPLNNLNKSCAEKEFQISTENYKGSKIEIIADVSLVGRHSDGPIKISFYAK